MIFASCADEKLIRSAEGRGIPIVLIDHDLSSPRVSTLRDDSYEGARTAVNYLAQQGHRYIALVHWNDADLNPWRIRGYRQGLRDASLPRRLRLEIFVELNAKGAQEAVRQFCSLTPRPSALFCFNNTLAQLIISSLNRFGLHVPNDVSVMGAGGEDLPDLTCTTIDWHKMGKDAVQLLCRLQTNKNQKPVHCLYPHTLKFGRTVRSLLMS